jgi:hypothetical protein
LRSEIRLTVAASEWPRSRVLSWIYFAAGVLALAFLLRYALIEPHSIGIACGEDAAPWWCAPRQAIVLMHAWFVWGWLGLLGGVLALVFGWGWALRIGFAMSLMGLVLYNADYAAPGLVLTLLRLPRS